MSAPTSAPSRPKRRAVFQPLPGHRGRPPQLAQLLARKEDGQLLGGTEFEIRDRVHRLGAQVVENVLRERKKKAIAGRGWAVRTARSRPGM